MVKKTKIKKKPIKSQNRHGGSTIGDLLGVAKVANDIFNVVKYVRTENEKKKNKVYNT
jgi:hypothetical protein